jgi:hypothetical protein
MTTATTSTSISNANNAGFQAWYNEVITQLGNIGLTQTSDTGQIGATASLPGAAHTSAGYTIWKFNDTLQATVPIFLKLEFGTGSVTSIPFMWITIGTGSNGSGTITNPSTRVACGADYSGFPNSTSTNVASYFCYNATYGFLGVAYKLGLCAASAATGIFGMGFIVCRGNTSAGAANSDAIVLLTSSSSATGPSGINGSAGAGSCMQCWSEAQSLYYPVNNSSGAVNQGLAWFTVPLFDYQGVTSPNNPSIFPCFYLAPAPTITNFFGIVNNSDVNVGSTFNATIIGSTQLTYLNVGGLFGSNTIGLTLNNITAQISTKMGDTTNGSGSYGVGMLYQ